MGSNVADKQMMRFGINTDEGKEIFIFASMQPESKLQHLARTVDYTDLAGDDSLRERSHLATMLLP